MIKTSFNTTKISYILVFMKDSELVQENREETLLHKRTDKNVKNYLSKVVLETGAVGYDVKAIKVEQVTCSIPYDVAMTYKQ